ncbi:MAG: hypothetical protein K2R98_13980 [Gemmataceae bacterium]|nr:hypothetical protein [Gemmataceae bacterium]
MTVNGRVSLTRIRWHGTNVGSVTPLDVYVDKAEQTISVGVREMACRLNGDSKNFDKAAENLARAAQVTVSGETLRAVIENEGRCILKAQQSGGLPLPWSASDCTIETKKEATIADKTVADRTRLYLGSDGVMVPLVSDVEKKKRRQKIKEKRRRRGKKAKPLPAAKPGADQKYKEFKIVAFYDETQEHRLVAGTKGDCTHAGRLMRLQAARIHFDQVDEKIGNVDGSPWIRNQIEGQSIPLDALGLDFYHLAENVRKARRAVYGEEAEAGQNWAGEVLHVFKHEGYEKAWASLVAWRATLRGKSKRQAADTLLGYASERHDMIRYPEFEKSGWQIGSGPTEATCKTLTARLKGSGMRWNAANAEALMAIEALAQSGLWKNYWQTLLPVAA